MKKKHETILNLDSRKCEKNAVSLYYECKDLVFLK